MSSDGITIITSEDEHGGTVVEITGVDLGQDTVTPETLLRGVTAHDSSGNPITGTGDLGGYTYLEPIELDVDLSVEEYDLEVDISELEYDLSLGTAIQNIIIRGKLPPGGEIGDLLAKRSLDDYDVGWITPANHAEQDNTRPITAAAVYTEIGNINALLATI